MQVLVGPTYNMEVSASALSPARVSDRSTSSGVSASAAAQGNNKAMSSSCLFFNGYEEEKENDAVGDPHNTFGSDGDSSSDSSSIGVPGDSEEEEDENDVVSSARNKFSSMDSLEDSLPNKRGLSNHYSGKSKSFGNLTEMLMSKSTAIKELEKQENPFNKRRRVLIANKWSRKFFYSQHNPKSMPLLPILPEDEDEDEEEEEDQRQAQEQYHDEQNKLKIKMSFKSQSCFCLADLAEEDEDDDED